MISSILNHPMVIKESWHNFTEQHHKTWEFLFQRQLNLLEKRAVPEFTSSLLDLDITAHQIPKFSDLNFLLQKRTGFSLVPVAGYIPAELFFKFLSQRMFPSTCFIRTPEQLDYLPEPDIFHDVFGHVPLLVQPVFADFMEAFGKSALEAIKLDLLEFATRIYWFTVEFGLKKTENGLKIYGAGILSSPGESIYSVESEEPLRIKFNHERIMKTDFHTDSFQKVYAAISDYSELFQMVSQMNWSEIKERLFLSPTIKEGIITEGDELCFV